MSATNTVDVYKSRWLAAVRSTPALTGGDKKVAEWLAAHLESGTTVHRAWSQMKRELNLPHHAAGVHLTTLTHARLVGERVRTGPDQGFPLEIPFSESKAERTASSYETRAKPEAKNPRRAAARRAADLRADAKWLAK
jgi:hypothetical protein